MGRYPRFYRQLLSSGELCYPSVRPWPSDLRPAGSGPGFPGTSFFLYLFASAMRCSIGTKAEMSKGMQIFFLLVRFWRVTDHCCLLCKFPLPSASALGRARVVQKLGQLGTFLFLVSFSWGAGFRQLLFRTLPRPEPEPPPWVAQDFLVLGLLFVGSWLPPAPSPDASASGARATPLGNSGLSFSCFLSVS